MNQKNLVATDLSGNDIDGWQFLKIYDETSSGFIWIYDLSGIPSSINVGENNFVISYSDNNNTSIRLYNNTII